MSRTLTGSCKFCSVPCRKSEKFCSAKCRAEFQLSEKKQALRRRLESECLRPKVVYEKVNQNPRTLQDVIDPLIERVYGEYCCHNTGKSWTGYWHPQASLPLIASLNAIRERIGHFNPTSYSISQDTVRNVTAGDTLPADWIRTTWELIAAAFLERHVSGSTSLMKADRTAGWGTLEGFDDKYDRGQLLSSSEKSDLTPCFRRMCKGVVPKNCEIRGTILGKKYDESQICHHLTEGQEFYAHVQRCPFSRGIHDTAEFRCDGDIDYYCLVSQDVPCTLVTKEVAESYTSSGPPRSFGEVPLTWIVEYETWEGEWQDKKNNWSKGPDWSSEVEAIISKMIDLQVKQ